MITLRSDAFIFASQQDFVCSNSGFTFNFLGQRSLSRCILQENVSQCDNKGNQILLFWQPIWLEVENSCLQQTCIMGTQIKQRPLRKMTVISSPQMMMMLSKWSPERLCGTFLFQFFLFVVKFENPHMRVVFVTLSRIYSDNFSDKNEILRHNVSYDNKGQREFLTTAPLWSRFCQDEGNQLLYILNPSAFRFMSMVLM